jgi:hypothetical protein
MANTLASHGMEKPRLYIETTIPSAYFDERLAPEMVARREDTRRWWATASAKYYLMTSMAVRKELASGPALRQQPWLALINPLPLLLVNLEVIDIAADYRRHKLMPPGDAMHLALASFYECAYLLTWNFRHLANANKFAHIQNVNRRLHLHVPQIVAPPALLEEDDEQA